VKALDAALDLATGVSQFGIWLRSALKDPAIAANGVKAMRMRAGALLDELFTGVGRGTRTGVANLGKNLYNGVLDLAELGFLATPRAACSGSRIRSASGSRARISRG
jgi:hypothetical protein